MKFRLPVLIAAIFGIVFLFSLAGCPNDWIEDLLNFKNKSPGNASADVWTVTFDSNGGSDVGEQSIAEGEKAAKPNDPTKLFVTRAGLYLGAASDFEYEFNGWFDEDNNLYDFDTPVTENITLIAQWTAPANTPPPIEEVEANDIAAAVVYVKIYPETYTLLIDEDVEADAQYLQKISDDDFDLTIIGIDSERTIQYSGVPTDYLFYVRDGASLTLGNNVTLKGIINGQAYLVHVNDGGSLTMKAGSKITGHTTSDDSAVYLRNSSTFTMEGGEISGNKSISGDYYANGGVTVDDGSQFVMSGGTITFNYGISGSIQSDVYIFRGSSLTLSGTAQIYMLRYLDLEDNIITIGKDYNGYVATLSLESNKEISALIKSFENKTALIKGETGHILNTNDISKFKIVNFFSYNGYKNRSITGNAIDSGDGNYVIALDTGANIGKLTRVFARGELLTDVEDIKPYLDSQSGDIDDPIPLNLKINLGTMTENGSNWRQLLLILEEKQKFVDLNLSRCTMTGTEFAPYDPFDDPTEMGDEAKGEDSGRARIVSIALPNTVTSIQDGGAEDYAFKFFTALRSFSGAGLTKIGTCAFTDCTSLNMITLPDTITHIGGSAFYNCTNLALTSLPGNLTGFGDGGHGHAFALCTNLRLTELPASITVIPEGAFEICKSLTEFTLHDGITDIGQYAFHGCTGLTTVTSLNPVPPTAEATIFATGALNLTPLANLEKIYVPARSVDLYKVAPGWSTYEDIIHPIGGTRNFTITVEQITDIADIEGGTISRVDNSSSGGYSSTITFVLDSSLTNPEWSIEGHNGRTTLTTASNFDSTTSCTVSATDSRYNSLGTHAVHLTVRKGGVPYSKTIWVTIVNDDIVEDFGSVVSINPTTNIFNVHDANEWNDAKNTISNGGNNQNYIINVIDDFDVAGGASYAVTFGNATGIKVSLRGYRRTLELSDNGKLIRTGANQTVILRGLTLQGRSGNNNSVVYVDNGNFTMQSGTITGNIRTSTSGGGYGGGVFVQSGTFIMNGGTISGNTAKYTSGGDGGGVYVNGGTFSMTGGEISGNEANNGGGGVYVTSTLGAFTMTGGTISGNTSSVGGGVGVGNGGAFTMTGGTISGNEATISGGGVNVSVGTFTMNSGEISGNEANNGGGGVYVTGTNSAFTMNGGIISANTGFSGGGVGVEAGGTFTMNSGEISGNKASSFTTSISGGGVMVLGDNSAFTMHGGKISKNEAGMGGGVYVGSGAINNHASFTMRGGEISGNTIGSGVYVYSGGTFRLITGTIYGLNEGANSNTNIYNYPAALNNDNGIATYGLTGIENTLSSNNNTIRVLNGVLQQ